MFDWFQWRNLCCALYGRLLLLCVGLGYQLKPQHFHKFFFFYSQSGVNTRPEMITIRFPACISGRIVSLQADQDIQKLHSNGNRIRIFETLLSIFRGLRLLEKVSHCTIIHLLFSEASFLPSVPWLQVCPWFNLCTVA